jgi:hypothetical protein
LPCHAAAPLRRSRVKPFRVFSSRRRLTGFGSCYSPHFKALPNWLCAFLALNALLIRELCSKQQPPVALLYQSSPPSL